MSRKMAKASFASKTSVATLGLLLVSTFIVFVPMTGASAQTQYVTASPGYINFGMNSTIQVTAPSAGTYSLIVQAPSGSKYTLSVSFASSGQSSNITFGSPTTGFNAVVDQVGTYKIYLENSTGLVSSTSFYVTNKLLVSMGLVQGGPCNYISEGTRGIEFFPRFLVTYASTGAEVTNSDSGIYVKFTLPNGSVADAPWDPEHELFVGAVLPNWNYPNVGEWNPNVTVGDAVGNSGVYNYVGPEGNPIVISPATLDTNITVVNSQTNQTLSGLANGTKATVFAVIRYPGNEEPVPGFVAPLDQTNRGGAVSAIVGWGYYNATSGTFGGGGNPGGQIAQVSMTYTGHKGVWEGNFTSNSVPAISPGSSYEIVVTSKDSATPPNTGFATVNLGPATGQVPTSTSTTQTSTSQSQSTISTSTIPVWAYAGTTIALIIGVIVGFLARRPK